jgi:hypothetical protein
MAGSAQSLTTRAGLQMRLPKATQRGGLASRVGAPDFGKGVLPRMMGLLARLPKATCTGRRGLQARLRLRPGRVFACQQRRDAPCE